MTRGDIKTLARYWLDDTAGSYFDDTFMNQVINNAQREAQKLLLNAGKEYYTKCVYTSTVADQARYALPSDFLKLMKLKYVTGGTGSSTTYQKIYPITRNQTDIAYTNTTGSPAYYYYYQSTLQLVPIPEKVYTLHLEYAYRVADLSSDGDTPDVPADYHEFLAILAARDGFLKDGRDMAPINQKLKYYEDMFKENAEQRSQDGPRYVRATSGGFGSV